MATTVGTRAPCSPDGRQRWRGGGYGPRGRRLVPATRRDGCLEASPRRASARMATPPMASWRDIAELSCTQRALNTPARPGLRAQSLRARGHNVDCTTNGRGRLAGHAAGGTGAALRAAAVRSSSPSPGRRAPTSPTVNQPGGADRRRSRELPLDGAQLVLGENETPPERLTVTAACTLDEVDGAPRITTSALTVRGYVPRLDTATLERNSRRRRNSARCRTRCAATSPSPSAKCSTGTELAEVGVSRTAPPTSRSRLDQAHDRIALLRIDPKPAKLWPKLFRTGWGAARTLVAAHAAGVHRGPCRAAGG